MKKYFFFCFLLLLFIPSGRVKAEVSSSSPEDLVVSEVALVPVAPVIGQKCKIIARVKNGGSNNISTSEGLNSHLEKFQDFVIGKTVYPAVSYDKPIAPNASVDYVYEGYFASTGTKALSFTVDQGDQVDEKYEDNNTGTRNVTVYNPDESDLVVSRIEPSVRNPLINESLKITVEIKNQGQNSLTDNKGFMFEDSGSVPSIPRDIFYDFSGFEVKTFALDKYPTLDSSLGTFRAVLEGSFKNTGDKKLTCNVNVNKRLIEKNYANNSASTTLSVYATSQERDAFRISDLRVETISSSSVKIFWSTDREMTTTLMYRQSIFSAYESILSSDKTSHSAVLSGLAPNGKYFYKVTGSYNGQMKETDLNEFTLAYAESVVISDLADASDNTRIRVSWKTSNPADSVLYYRRAGQSSDSVVSSKLMATSHSLETGVVLPYGEYSYRVSSRNAYGTSSESKLMSIRIGPLASSSAEAKPAEKPDTAAADAIAKQTVTTLHIQNAALYKALRGKIILRVGKSGEAYYISPDKQEMYYLGRPDDAFLVMRQKGIGISNADLRKIPAASSLRPGDKDADGDGLSDAFEDAIGTDKSKKDTDGDSFSDKTETDGGYDPLLGKNAKSGWDSVFAEKSKGKIFLAVEMKGEAWFVSPGNGKKHFLGRPSDAFAVMRELGTGISEDNFAKLQ